MKNQILKFLILLGALGIFSMAALRFVSAEDAVPINVRQTMPDPLVLTFGQSSTTISSEVLASWQTTGTIPQQNITNYKANTLMQTLNAFFLRFSEPSNNSALHYQYAPDKIYDYVSKLSESIELPTLEPSLTIDNGKVTSLTLPQTGKKVDVYSSTFNILNALQAGSTSSTLSITEIPPSKTLGDTNSLGIKELVGEGISKFNGSPKNRRHNIAVGADKFKGVIIPQGATFSFDDNLGPVEAAEGFLPELVIKGTEGTIPELGGGLCQVSTTTFRAAMDAGLPITDRRNHSYAVSYYSPQGTDATIYPGSADLKFVNDTPGAILIWSYEKDPNTLVFDFYGTKDSRQVTLEKPVVYDRQADGSMKATWTRLVTNNGQTRTDVFKSNYLPPALFHKTETFVSATGTQSSGLQMPSKVQ